MMEKGSAMIGYQPLGTKVNFFRCVLSNPATQQEDIDFLLDQIIQLGHDLWRLKCFIPSTDHHFEMFKLEKLCYYIKN